MKPPFFNTKSIKKRLKNIFPGRRKQSSTGTSNRIEGAKLSDEDEEQDYFESLHNVFNALETMKPSEIMIDPSHRDLLKDAIKDKLQRVEYEKSENKSRVADLQERGGDAGQVFEDEYCSPLIIRKKRIKKRVRRKINVFDCVISAGAILVSFCVVSVSGSIEESKARRFETPQNITQSAFRLANAFELYNQKRF